MSSSERPEFGEYLRRRRAAMAPPEPPGSVRASQRRVPGLRRQELADVAGISVEYYTRLEQGKAPRPSREILAALARAFALSPAERDHLFRLGGESPPEPESPEAVIRPGLRRLLRGLDDTMPVTVHDGRLDLLGRNAAAAEHRLPGLHRHDAAGPARRRRRRTVHPGRRGGIPHGTEPVPGR